MIFAEYLKQLDQPQTDGGNPLEEYAARVPTSVGYLRVHVISARKMASLRYMRALAQASGDRVSLLDVLRHYGVPEEELQEKAA